MALIKCKECGKEISNEVKSCPNCGSTKHRGFFKKHPIISIILGVFVVSGIINSFSDKNQNVAEKQEKSPVSSNVQEGRKKDIREDSSSIPNNNLTYQKDEDKMRGTTTTFAINESTTTLQLGFPYNDSKMKIVLRKDGKETDVMLQVKGQIVCNSFSERCYVSVKNDDKEIVKYDFVETAHGRNNTVFIKKEKEFIEALKNSKKIIAEVPLYDKGRQQYEFNVEGVKWE